MTPYFQIQDFSTLIDHISQCLRPGGLMEIVDYDFKVYDGNGKPFSLPTGVLHPPYFAQWISLLNIAVRQRGGSPDAATMLHTWTLQHPDFEDVVYEDYFVPTAPFISPGEPNYHVTRTIAEYLREDMLVRDYDIRDLPPTHRSHLLFRLFFEPVGLFYWEVGFRNLS